MDGKSRNRVLVRLFFLLLFCLLFGAILYETLGERVIADLYHGKLPFTSITLFSSEPSRPLDYYLMRAEIIVWQFLVVGLPVTILVWILLGKVFRRLLSIQRNPGEFDGGELRCQFRYDVCWAALLYTLLTLIYSHPIIEHFSDAMLGPPEDNMLSYWNLWWLKEMVLTGIGTLTCTSYLYYPEGTSMYYHAWSFYNMALASALGVFMSPVAVYNTLVLSTFPLSGLGAFLLAKYLTKNSYMALLAGFMFAFSPFHVARALHHLNLSTLQFLPLFVLFFIRAIRDGGAGNVALAAVFMLLNALSDWTYMIFACYFMVLSYAYLAIRRKRLLLIDVIAKSAVAAGTAIVILSPWLWKMVSLAIQSTGVKGGGRTLFVADLLAYIVPGALHRLGNTAVVDSINSSYTGNSWEAATYLGIPALTLVVLASRKHLPAVAKYMLGGLAFLTFTFGPELHILGRAMPIVLPDTIIAHLPLLSSVRAPGRYVVLVYLFWSVITAISAGILIRSVKRAGVRRLLVVALPLILFADYCTIYREKTEIDVPQCYDLIPDQEDEFGILDLPRGYIAVNSYMLYQTEHGHPIVQGWVSRKLEETLIDRLDLENLDIQKEQLVEAGVKYIVLHKYLQIEETVDPSAYGKTYELVAEDDRNALFRVY